jgi:Leucine-rich repeat (LRR) protein
VAPHLDLWPPKLRHHVGLPDDVQAPPVWWRLLRSLDLRGTRFPTEHDLRFVLGGPSTAGVTHLDLSLCQLNSAERLAAAVESLPDTLETLDISANPLSGEPVAALPRSEVSFGLRELDIGGTGLNAGEIAHLSRWEAVDGLRELSVARCALRGANLRRVATARALRRLEVLDASETGLRDGGLAALTEGRALDGLRRLDLRQNAIHGDGLEALARRAGGTLTRLDLSKNPLSELATLSAFQAVDDLGLSACGLDRKAASRLSVCVMPSLQSLDLSDNPLTDAGCSQLARGPILAMVRDLNLSSCALRGLRLPQLLSNSRLRRLNLGDNTLRSAAVRHLTDWAGFTDLESLDLTQNLLQDRDATLLSRHLPASSAMTSLAVDSNYLGDGGAIALIGSGRASHLSRLTLGGQLSPAVVGALLERGSETLVELRIAEEDDVPVHDWGPVAVALSRCAAFPSLKVVALPRFDVDLGVGLIRAPPAMARAIFRGCPSDWLRTLAARLSVRFHHTASHTDLVERLLAFG